MRFFLALFLQGLAVSLAAQHVDLCEFYSRAQGKSGAELKTALYEISREGHRKRSYRNVSRFFEEYDLTEEGLIWDMYAKPRCSQWNGRELNREHVMPKSWFGLSDEEQKQEPIMCDYHNLFPSDSKANSAKSNYPLGLTDGEKFDNGTSKVGVSTRAGYTGMVFEPADEYKGDFARTYMYMVTRYEDHATRWTGTGTKSMLTDATYPAFTTYAIELLMEWHRRDPVSRKEIDRNEAVGKAQGNRNPFIDHPDFAEHIWGDKRRQAWRCTGFSLTIQGEGALFVYAAWDADGGIFFPYIFTPSAPRVE